MFVIGSLELGRSEQQMVNLATGRESKFFCQLKRLKPATAEVARTPRVVAAADARRMDMSLLLPRADGPIETRLRPCGSAARAGCCPQPAKSSTPQPSAAWPANDRRRGQGADRPSIDPLRWGGAKRRTGLPEGVFRKGSCGRRLLVGVARSGSPGREVARRRSDDSGPHGAREAPLGRLPPGGFL